MYQIKSLGVVGGALGRNAKLKFQHRITEKSVFLIYQYTFWKFSIVNTINCNFALIMIVHYDHHWRLRGVLARPLGLAGRFYVDINETPRYGFLP